MDKRLFTVQEANELIPFLTERLSRLDSLLDELRRLTDLFGAPDEQDVALTGGSPVPPERFQLLCQVTDVVNDVGDQGCLVKDLEKGLIDFPTLWQGREVFLCWRRGEGEVTYWHEQEEGFAGRQEIAANWDEHEA